MSFWRLVLKSVIYHRRAAWSTALCVAAAVAVLAGALLVGDSVRGTLRHLALDRLGPYDDIILSPQPFRAALADELAAKPGFRDHFLAAEPILLMRGTLELQAPGGTRRSSGVTIVGCRQSFWTAGNQASAFAPPDLKGDAVALNAALAAQGQLGAHVGDEVILRIAKAGGIPADSALGQKERSETLAGRELTVKAIVPNAGLGQFSLSRTQQASPCAFVDLATLQAMLDQAGRANAILLAGRLDVDKASAAEWTLANTAAANWLNDNLRPKLADYGLQLRHVVIGDRNQPANDYWSLTSQRMLLPADVETAAAEAWQGLVVQPALTYLANDLQHAGRHIPYSTIAAVDSRSPIGPLSDAQGKPLTLRDDEIVLTDWAANDLAAKPGDTIDVTWFEPETTHGQPREVTAPLTLKAIVPLAEAGAPPLRTNDPDLTPELKGVTDSKSIDKWLVPFKLTRPIRPRDDQYWTDHRTTPKAYVSLATGRKHWHSRFGQTTSLRVAAAPGIEEVRLAELLERQINPARLGLAPRQIKQDALAAATGTTPFDVLFLAFSAFLIVATLMLLTVLFQLGVDERARDVGLLLAVGIAARTITRILLAEALLVAAMGTLVGLVVATGYAWLVLAGLRTGWLAAVAAPQLELYVTPRSLLVGGLAGLAATIATIYFAVRRVGRVPVRLLLAGVSQADKDRDATAKKATPGRTLSSYAAAIVLLLAASLAAGSAIAATELQAALFFGSGALMLTGGLLAFRSLLQSRRHAPTAARVSLPWLAARNATLHPRRSLLCVGLLATVTFLIIATSAFRLDVSSSGSGGFDLLAESPLPFFHDLASPEGRAALGMTGAENELLTQANIVALRVHDGDDASCLNLYRPQQPRVLGIPRTLADSPQTEHRFDWGATMVQPPTRSAMSGAHEAVDNPWRLLDGSLPDDAQGRPTIPVILDENTARYSLGLMRGVGETYAKLQDAAGRPVTLQVVGLLRNSIFQGDLLISEQNLLRLFPDTQGYRYFLVRAPAAQSAAVSNLLEDRLADFGLDVTPARDRLAALLAVQNAYLATFQSLGALGLLLGTFGLAAVQLRSVLERRGELALLRAEGFARRRIAALVLWEIATLMIAGVSLGAAAATIAVAPHLWQGAARLPWLMLCVTLLVILGCGFMAGLAAVRAVVKMPIVAALRGE